MPEGPSIVILKESAEKFKGKRIIAAKGNAKIDIDRLINKTIIDFKSWGKQFFICLSELNIRIHFLLFGSYSIDEQTKPDRSLRLALSTKKGTMYFYTCSVRLIDDSLDDLYKWETDVMNDNWNVKKSKRALKSLPNTMVCDALLDQEIFSGVGNIIKDEVLYRIGVHPESLIGDIPPKKR